LVAVALAAVTIVYGLFLVFVGQKLMVYAESPEGGTYLGDQFRPAIAGIIPAVGGALLLVGLLLRSQPISVIGWLVVAAFAGLSVFGIGGWLVPVALALLLCLIVLDRSPADTLELGSGDITER
jgi:hypothetical protein